MINFNENLAENFFSAEERAKRQELLPLININRKSIEDFERVTEEALAFKRAHPDCYEYLLFHDLIGSTPPASVNKFDTPNHDLENLIKGLDEKIHRAAA